MVKVGIVSKSKGKKKEIIRFLRKHNLKFTKSKPDIVISYGGDGMFLISEDLFPGVPKVLLRDSKICNNCTNLDKDEIFERINKGKYSIKKIPKIKAIKNSKKKLSLIGVNDIVIRNLLPTEAIRFEYKINNKTYSKEILGDGVVISTPFGSNPGTYFYTITRKTLKNGFGLAFNNTTIKKSEIKLKPKDKIKISISRGPGVLVADNNRKFIHLKDSDYIEISIDKSTAKLVTFD